MGKPGDFYMLGGLTEVWVSVDLCCVGGGTLRFSVPVKAEPEDVYHDIFRMMTGRRVPNYNKVTSIKSLLFNIGVWLFDTFDGSLKPHTRGDAMLTAAFAMGRYAKTIRVLKTSEQMKQEQKS